MKEFAQQRPGWLRTRLPGDWSTGKVGGLMDRLQIHTVCRSAACPNIGECYHAGTATFLILGGICTRSCRFCAVPKGVPAPVNPAEPAKLAEAVRELNLSHVVITSVTRDDLPDGGAAQFAACIQAIRAVTPAVTIEVLTPDFQGSTTALTTVLREYPDVFNHNIESVPRFYPTVRPEADYQRSLAMLRLAADRGNCAVKSGMMLGFGETESEVADVLRALRQAGVSVVTIGQYLQPSAKHLPVSEYVHPDTFFHYETIARQMGFLHVAASPLIRSSYHAADFVK